MGLIDRFRNRQRATGPGDDTGYLAVPLTPDEVALLVEAYRADDRLTRLHRPDIGGSSYAGSQAQYVSQRAGVAAALGHPTTPMPVNEIGMLDYVLQKLQQYAPGDQVTRRFELLLTRMHILAGMAHVHGWRAGWAEGGLRWHPHPPVLPGDTAPVQRQQIAELTHEQGSEQ